MIENLIHLAVPIGAFILGIIITNLFKSGKIRTLKTDLEEKDSRYFELQNSSKKQLGERDSKIKNLQNEFEKVSSGTKATAKSNKELLILKDKNETLEKELNKVSAKLKEFKIEKAVSKVDEKYPMELYEIDDDMVKSDEPDAEPKTETAKKEKKKAKSKSGLVKKKKSKSKTKKLAKTKAKKDKKTTTKSKKKKKKLKSKKQKANKALDLNQEAYDTRRGLKIKKKKKSKSK